MSEESNKVDFVRELVRQRLGQLTRGVGDFRETYLMSDSKFTGIRFEQGLFQAVWKLENSEVQVLREQQQILLISIDGQAGQKAA